MNFKKHFKDNLDSYSLLLALLSLVFPPLLTYLGVKIWLIVSLCIWIIFAFIYLIVKFHKKLQRYLISGVIIFFTWYAIFIFCYNPNPLIFWLAEWYSLRFEDEIKSGNLLLNKKFPWTYKQDGFENGQGEGIFADSLTIKSWAYPERKYVIYQDIRKYNGDYILISKFYLKDKSSIGFDFIKEVEPWTRGSSYQSCGITTQNWVNWAWFIINNSSNYIDFFNGQIMDYTEAQRGKFTEWSYYILAKVENWKLSCFYQKDWESSYNSIVSNVWLKMNELAGPKLIKYSATDEPKPYLLDLWIYSK